MPSILIIGASRGLGAELVKKYASSNHNTVFATSRSGKSEPPDAGSNVTWIPGIDVAEESAGSKLAAACKSPIDIVIITAGYFGKESFDEPNWEKEVKMYTTSSIGPVFIVHHLVKSGVIPEGAKIMLISSEGGSITLRHESEGGGNYGHHASKAALNMVGKLLSLDLKDKGISVGILHVSLEGSLQCE
jgi:short-subunit dehydrogenase